MSQNTGETTGRYSLERISAYLETNRAHYDREILRQQLLQDGCPPDLVVQAINRVYSSQTTSSDQPLPLYWPPIPSGSILLGWISVVVGFTILIFMFFIFIPLGILLISEGGKQKKLALEKRKYTMDTTRSVLMSRANYVGGHPMIPNASTIVLGLSANQIVIYSINIQHAIQPTASIPLKDIVRVGMGRPKSAREVYDEDDGYTIDVYEQSPFLSLFFKLRGDTYRASFQSLEPDTPPDNWYNQITALKYQLTTASNP